MPRHLLSISLLCLLACSPSQYRETKSHFLANEPAFEVLTKTLLAHPGIRELSLGSSPALNERILIADSLPPDSNHVGGWHQLPYHMAITDAGLSRAEYDAIVGQMKALGVLSAYITDENVVLVLGGFTDNEYGVLLPRDGHPLPALNTSIADGVQLVFLQYIRNSWVYFATT